VRSKIAWTVPVLAAVLIAIALTQFNLSAQQEPGPVETAIANRAKRFFIHRASRQGIPSRPVDRKTSIENGAAQYGLECSICHGDDGRGQKEPGRWQYPRAADLTSRRVQSYSDEELFWIIQNGIRDTGMPSFAKVEAPDHIWDLVNYVRTLPGDLQTQGSSK
jgi:mono/diheme cytochrome c family protein